MKRKIAVMCVLALTGTMMLTACGNNGNITSDEVEKDTGDTTEKNDSDKNKQDKNDTPDVLQHGM